MKSIIEVIKTQDTLVHGTGCDNKTVLDAEKALGVSFSDDYKDYLINYGIAAFGGHELTGLTKSERLNVVNVTLNERACNEHNLKHLYVIEDTGIDWILIWQSSDGAIYQTTGPSEAVKICNSFEEYIEM